MGAVPKNKITRRERGKRRAGNRPNLKQDTNVAKTPLFLRGLVAQIKKMSGYHQAQNNK